MTVKSWAITIAGAFLLFAAYFLFGIWGTHQIDKAEKAAFCGASGYFSKC